MTKSAKKRSVRWLRRLIKIFAGLVFGLILITVLMVVLARLWVPSDLPPVQAGDALVIDNVNVLTMGPEGVLLDRQVVIRDGLIEAIGESGQLAKPDYKRVDAAGAWLMPGLFDMHFHAMDRKYLVSALAHGVTSVRNMGGYPMHLRWREELSEGRWLGSNLFSASPTMNGARNANPFGHKVFTEPDEARKAVQNYHEQGWDFLKIYARLEVEVYEAIIDEAARVGIPAAGHVPYPVVEYDYSLARHMVTLEHTEDIFQGPLDYEYDDERLAEIISDLRAMDATLTPTLMIFDHLTQIARQRQEYLDAIPSEYLNPLMKTFEDHTSVERWLGASEKRIAYLEKENDYLGSITRALYEADVTLVLGSDGGVIYAVPGLSTHEEIRLLEQAGIPSQAILEMATVNSAKVLGVEDRLGKVAIGMDADLVLTRDNPLQDLSRLRQPLAVVKSGQYLDERALESLHESARNPSGYFLSMGRMMEFLFSE